MSTIVKVQVSLFNSEGKKMMLVYDKEKKYVHEIEADENTINSLNMENRPKAFFNAKIDEKAVAFLDEAPWQTW